MSSTKIEMPTRPVAPPARPHGGWARSLVMRRLASLARGSLTVLEHGTRTHFEGTEPGPLATLEVRDARLWRRVVWGGQHVDRDAVRRRYLATMRRLDATAVSS